MPSSLIRACAAGLMATVALAPAARVARGQSVAGSRVSIDTTIELASFDTVWTRIRDTYYDPAMHGLDWNHVREEYRPLAARASSHAQARAAIEKMLATLGDSHFGIVPGEASPSAESSSSADSPGDVGLDLRFIGTDLVVTRVDSGSAAARAGVIPGWAVDQIDTTSIALLRRAVDTAGTAQARRRTALRVVLGGLHRLQGEAGSTVHIVFRDVAGARVDRDIVRQAARGTVVRLGSLPPLLTWLESRRIGAPNACTGVIRFNTWMTPVAPAFEDALDGMRSCDGIVLDLRGNVGGLASMITGIAGHFTNHEMLLGVLHMRGNDLRYVANPRRSTRAGATVEPFSGSLAIVVDELSASTTEIFASALQQQGRARIFGDTTAGQALPSVLAKLPNGDALQYAVADLTDPGGRRLEGKGVVPDAIFPLSRRALFANHDEALQAALQWIGSDRHKRRGSGY